MFDYQRLTLNYTDAIIVGLCEYYHPKFHWQHIEIYVDAILEFKQFENQLRFLIKNGATKLGFLIQDSNGAQYTVYVSTSQWIGTNRITARKIIDTDGSALSALE